MPQFSIIKRWLLFIDLIEYVLTCLFFFLVRIKVEKGKQRMYCTAKKQYKLKYTSIKPLNFILHLFQKLFYKAKVI